MGRFAIFLLVLLLLANMGGFPSHSQEDALLEALEGTWYSEGETLSICSGTVEITGYYELEGQRLAGTVLQGSISIAEDGTLELQVEDQARTGYLEDENTMILGEIRYTRS